MNRDYKHVGSRDVGGKDAAPRPPLYKGPLVFLAGLAPGLALAVVVHFYHVFTHEPVPPVGVVVDTLANSGDAQEDEYQFFTILTELEIVVPDYQDIDKAQRPTYVLQAGSFRAQRTAESLQKRLEALDLESEVQKVEMGEGDVWYRVRLGPYDNLSQVNNIRLNLRKQGIESMLKKRPPTAAKSPT